MTLYFKTHCTVLLINLLFERTWTLVGLSTKEMFWLMLLLNKVLLVYISCLTFLVNCVALVWFDYLITKSNDNTPGSRQKDKQYMPLYQFSLLLLIFGLNNCQYNSPILLGLFTFISSLVHVCTFHPAPGGPTFCRM